tara:strand:- start:483 stop:1178 length:696 start_codon:yes stop_codon:yes gene_type:complete
LTSHTRDIDSEILLDLNRENRTGLAEAIFCEGKSVDQLLSIADRLHAQEKPMLFTRLAQDAWLAIEARFPGLLDYDPISRTSISQAELLTSSVNASIDDLAVITGGTSDLPVAREVIRTLEYYQQPLLTINDVGVAGLWRLMDRVEEIKTRKVVICIAGMDAALPTVLGGLIGSAIIAVPTSVGYGMVKGGETALQSLLVSCAPGLTVVNIDNGYGAACAALRILNQINRT